MFLGGDTIVRAGNSLEALELSADNLHFADGQSAAFLSGDSAQCVIGEDYAERTGLHPGDTLSLEIYTVRQSMNGTIYQMIGDAALEIIGTHSAPGGADVILPVNFLRTEAETAGVSFLYDSCSALVDDSTHLKDFKAEMQKYFMDINPSAGGPERGRRALRGGRAICENGEPPAAEHRAVSKHARAVFCAYHWACGADDFIHAAKRHDRVVRRGAACGRAGDKRAHDHL